jgi:hypothetical protein
VDVIAVPTPSEGAGRGPLDLEYLRGLARVGEWTETRDGQSFVREEAARARELERRSNRREETFRLQAAMRPLFSACAPAKGGGQSPMAKCGLVRFRKGPGVEVRVDVKGRASLRGVVSCGRRSCPKCGASLLPRDAELVEAGVAEHGYDRTLMATLTVRHGRGQTLLALRKGIVGAWGDLQRQRAFKKLLERHGSTVFVRVLETTHREANGWHVHYHALVFLGGGLSDADLKSFQRRWATLWRASVVRTMGAAHRPTLAAGAWLTRCHRADYLTKLGIGAEVTDVGQAKIGKGRTYWRIARDWAAAGADRSDRDARLLEEYIREMKGAVIVAWPRQGPFTRKRLQERHPEERPPSREETVMHDEEWDALRRLPDGPLAVLRAAELAPLGHVDAAVREVLDDLLTERRCSDRPTYEARAP